MTRLPLAVDIADAVSSAAARGQKLDIPSTAERLVDDHPEAEASQQEVATALAGEIEHAGMSAKD